MSRPVLAETKRQYCVAKGSNCFYKCHAEHALSARHLTMPIAAGTNADGIDASSQTKLEPGRKSIHDEYDHEQEIATSCWSTGQSSKNPPLFAASARHLCPDPLALVAGQNVDLQVDRHA
jgi:hypothetical protein